VAAEAFLAMKFKDRALGFLPPEVKAGVEELIHAAREHRARR
jgi:hypothetical protein